MLGEELDEADNEHHRGVLDVDDEVVADLGHDVPQGLGKNDAGHGLDMVHTDGLGSLGLSRVDGDDPSPYTFGHICPCVDGNHQQRSDPDTGVALEGHGPVGEVGEAVVDEDRLKHHRGAPEDLHIGRQNRLHRRHKAAGDGGGPPVRCDAADDADHKADQAPQDRTDNCQFQRDTQAPQEIQPVLVP